MIVLLKEELHRGLNVIEELNRSLHWEGHLVVIVGLFIPKSTTQT